MRSTRAGEEGRGRRRPGAAGAARGRGRGAPIAAAIAGAIAIASAAGCKGKPKEDPIPVPPPQGAASADELTTAIGQARAIGSSLAPTSTRWKRAVVLDERRAILIGEVVNETIAMFTDNAGRTWRSLRMERDGWSTWSVGAEGAAVLTLGARVAPQQPSKDPRSATAPADPLRLHFAAFDATELSAPSAVTLPKRSPTAKLPVDVIPAVLSADRAAMVIEEAPRRSLLVYSGLAGAEPIPPVKLPPTEQMLPTPYGRPPMLLSSRGRDLLVRAVPEPGKPLDPPQKVAGVLMTPPVAAQLAGPPACELEGWSFQVVKQVKDTVVAISRQKTAAFPLPAKAAQGAAPGCGAGRIAVEIEDPKPPDPSDPLEAKRLKVSTLAICPLDAPCAVPQKPPFRPWLEPHEQSMAAVPTSTGAVAVLTERAGPRWGIYLAHSQDGGKLFEVPRVIGEGMGERGRIELGALISIGNRILMVLEADVTGTSRRSWYVTASDDGGLTWNAP